MGCSKPILTPSLSRLSTASGTADMLDLDTIQNFVRHLGRSDFDATVTLLLTRAFDLIVIKVDSPGDGGSDRRAFTRSGGSTAVAYQVTVQNRDWMEKAIADAHSARRDLSATQYFFLTNQPRQSKDLRNLEQTITAEVGLPTTCLGAREIAGLLIENDLLSDFFDSIGAPLPSGVTSPLDQHERLLHAYVALSPDTKELRESVYDDTLLFTLYSSTGALQKEELVDAALDLLGAPKGRRAHLEGRVDSLQTRGHIVYDNTTLRFHLSPDSASTLSTADRLYSAELEMLARAQQQVINDLTGAKWSLTDARSLAVLLARSFIQRQLQVARQSAGSVASVGLFRQLGDPLLALREFLLSRQISRESLDDLTNWLVHSASEVSLMKKLTRATLYVALEGTTSVGAPKALGVKQWHEATVFLDASVIIPFVCARLFGATDGRFSQCAVESVEAFTSLGATVKVPSCYVEETAAHLVRALDYKLVVDADPTLQYSHNGFVAHFTRLRAAGGPVPPSLEDFLAHIAPSINNRASDYREWIRRLSSELSPTLRRYSIEYEFIPPGKTHYRNDVEKIFAFVLDRQGRRKVDILIEDDVRVLSHIRKLVEERSEGIACLTWDAALIDTAREIANCGWIVTPHDAVDFTCVCRPLSDQKLCALSHALASARERPQELTARIVDRVVELATNRLQDYQFVDRIRQLRERLMSRIRFDDPNCEEWIRSETDAFLRDEGIEVSSER